MSSSLRSQRVIDMIEGLAAEGMEIHAADGVLLDAYVGGKITGRDMLAHCLQFPTITAYRYWLHQNQGIHIDEQTATVSTEQVICEFRACMKRRQSVADINGPSVVSLTSFQT